MSLFRRLALLRHRNPSSFISYPHVSQKRCFFTSIFGRTRSVNSEEESIFSGEKSETPKKMRRLDVFFKEALGLSPRTEEYVRDNESGASDLSLELKQLETKIRSLNEEQNPEKVHEVVMMTEEEEKEKDIKPKAPSLAAVFMKRTTRRIQSERLPEASVTIKKLSPEMKFFLDHLHSEGYFRDASFMKNGRLESDWYRHSCGRDFIKFATDKFGKDHKEIAKLLLSSELKKFALFGCPSVSRRNTSAAKSLRVFFSIPEQTVCGKCALRSSCKFVNQQLGGKSTKMAKNELSLLCVLRVISLYALELVPPGLTIPDDLKVSANQLLRHIVELSRTTGTVEVKT